MHITLFSSNILFLSKCQFDHLFGGRVALLGDVDIEFLVFIVIVVVVFVVVVSSTSSISRSSYFFICLFDS